MKKKALNKKSTVTEQKAYYVGLSRGLGVKEKHFDRNSDPNFITYGEKNARAYYKGLAIGKKMRKGK